MPQILDMRIQIAQKKQSTVENQELQLSPHIHRVNLTELDHSSIAENHLDQLSAIIL